MNPYEAWLRAQAIRVTRTLKGVLAVAKRHMPKWMAAVITVALLIPGPQDELAVMLIVGAWMYLRPTKRGRLKSAAMRSDFKTTVSQAWNIY